MSARALVYPNGVVLALPQYNPEFVRRMKALVPPNVRDFHQLPTPSYTIVAPHHRIALALAAEYLEATETREPYTFPGDDRHLSLWSRRGAGRRREEVRQ